MKKKIVDMVKKQDSASEQTKGLQKLINSLFDDMMKVEDDVQKNK